MQEKNFFRVARIGHDTDLMFSEKFLMSDVLATILMLTGLLFSFTTFP